MLALFLLALQGLPLKILTPISRLQLAILALMKIHLKKKTEALNSLAGYQNIIHQCDASGDIALTITEHEVANTASNNQEEDEDKGGSHGQKKSKKAANKPGYNASLEIPPKIFPFVQAGQQQDLDNVFQLAGCAPLGTLQSVTNAPSSSPSLAPKMSLVDFYVKYDLLLNIYNKLCDADITVPHGLHFLTPVELEASVKLTLGEQCDVMDALEHFKKNVD
ncbi:hypothetical protein BT96DRAFT_941034 [Gymnopus androsaceus JB14]|uniref:Uncharacterized protein n=1 Tax=Gymnopus androsaceus JB14 TaxID=1447944 RepID=A0A6A4HH37_9AGAR|nr:hypothetical protein BT96DRAFT_941034 [Gymnopus androsaceus JB14]